MSRMSLSLRLLTLEITITSAVAAAPISAGKMSSMNLLQFEVNIGQCFFLFMADQQTSPPSDKNQNKKEEKKKGVMSKLQEITPDREEQVALVGVAVRLAIVVWSGFCLTLAYIDLPGFPKQTFDPTFIASVFTGALSTFGLATTKDKKSNGVSKEDMEAMIAKSNTQQTEQIIRVQTPIRIQSPDGGEIQQVVQAPPKPPTPETKA